VTAEGHGSAKDPWQAWLEATISAGPVATGSPWSRAAGAGLDTVAAWYRWASQELGAVMAARASDPASRAGLDAFARAFFAGGAAARGPGAFGTPTAAPGSPLGSFGSFGSLGSFGPAAPPGPGEGLGGSAGAALGPTREHQQRAAALAAAAAEYGAAQQALAPLLVAAAGSAAAAFAARLAAGTQPGARTALELWIECADGAWQDLAHGEAWCDAQARAIHAALAVVACRDDLVEDAARLAGLPSRRELDELQRRVRTLERERGE
jgi:hypothetical protein